MCSDLLKFFKVYYEKTDCIFMHFLHKYTYKLYVNECFCCVSITVGYVLVFMYEYGNWIVILLLCWYCYAWKRCTNVGDLCIGIALVWRYGYQHDTNGGQGIGSNAVPMRGYQRNSNDW